MILIPQPKKASNLERPGSQFTLGLWKLCGAGGVLRTAKLTAQAMLAVEALEEETGLIGPALTRGTGRAGRCDSVAVGGRTGASKLDPELTVDEK